MLFVERSKRKGVIRKCGGGREEEMKEEEGEEMEDIKERREKRRGWGSRDAKRSKQRMTE